VPKDTAPKEDTTFSPIPTSANSANNGYGNWDWD